ncbi:MAG: SRPBCC family protein, partial [Bacteroidota bacterium]
QAAGDADKPSKKSPPAKIGMLNIHDFTSAPLQVVKQRTVKATPEQLWAYINNSETLPKWVKQIKKVDVSRDAEGNDVARTCSFGGDKINEDIVHVETNRVFAYKAHDNEMVSNHLGVVHIEPQGEESVITWYQFFDKGSNNMKASMMKMMMCGMLNKEMKNLEKVAG